MRLLYALIILSIATPCLAGRRPQNGVDVRGGLSSKIIFNQDSVLIRFLPTLRNEGLNIFADALLTKYPLEHLKASQLTDDFVIIAQASEKPEKNEDDILDDFVVIESTDQASFNNKSIGTSVLSENRGIGILTTNVTLSSEELDVLLIERFQELTQSAMTGQLTKVSGSAAFDTAVGAFAFLTGFGTGITVKALTSISALLHDGISAMSDIRNIEFDPLYKYYIMYVKMKRFLPEGTQKEIERLFDLAFQTENGLTEAGLKIPILLSIPLKSSKPDFNFMDRITAIAESYQIKDKKQNFAEELLLDTVGQYANFQSGAGPNKKPRIQICLLGRPGIGKTQLVEEYALSRKMPCISLSLEQGLEAVFGTSRESGTLLSAIENLGNVREFILCLDEADSVLNEKNVGFWKTFLDRRSFGFKSQYTKDAVDLSHAMIFICCNEPIANEAIKSRLKIYELLAPTDESKRSVLTKFIIPWLGNSEVEDMTVVEGELPDGFLNSIIEVTKGKGYREAEVMIEREMNKVRLGRLRLKLNRHESPEKPSLPLSSKKDKIPEEQVT